MGKTRRESVETIVWRDAWSGYDGATERKDIEPHKFLVSVGFLVSEDKDEVRIAMQTTLERGDDRVRHVSGIPKKMIVSRSSRPVNVPILPERSVR